MRQFFWKAWYILGLPQYYNAIVEIIEAPGERETKWSEFSGKMTGQGLKLLNVRSDACHPVPPTTKCLQEFNCLFFFVLFNLITGKKDIVSASFFSSRRQNHFTISKARPEITLACMSMLWFKFILGLKFFELVSILFAIEHSRFG